MWQSGWEITWNQNMCCERSVESHSPAWNREDSLPATLVINLASRGIRWAGREHWWLDSVSISSRNQLGNERSGSFRKGSCYRARTDYRHVYHEMCSLFFSSEIRRTEMATGGCERYIRLPWWLDSHSPRHEVSLRVSRISKRRPRHNGSFENWSSTLSWALGAMWFE